MPVGSKTSMGAIGTTLLELLMGVMGGVEGAEFIPGIEVGRSWAQFIYGRGPAMARMRGGSFFLLKCF